MARAAFLALVSFAGLAGTPALACDPAGHRDMVRAQERAARAQEDIARVERDRLRQEDRQRRNAAR